MLNIQKCTITNKMNCYLFRNVLPNFLTEKLGNLKIVDPVMLLKEVDDALELLLIFHNKLYLAPVYMVTSLSAWPLCIPLNKCMINGPLDH